MWQERQIKGFYSIQGKRQGQKRECYYWFFFEHCVRTGDKGRSCTRPVFQRWALSAILVRQSVQPQNEKESSQQNSQPIVPPWSWDYTVLPFHLGREGLVGISIHGRLLTLTEMLDSLGGGLEDSAPVMEVITGTKPPNICGRFIWLWQIWSW